MTVMKVELVGVLIKQWKFTLTTQVVWFLFILWSSQFTNKCLAGIYNGCESSSGFAETFSVINMAAMMILIPILIVSVFADTRKKYK